MRPRSVLVRTLFALAAAGSPTLAQSWSFDNLTQAAPLHGQDGWSFTGTETGAATVLANSSRIAVNAPV